MSQGQAIAAFILGVLGGALAAWGGIRWGRGAGAPSLVTFISVFFGLGLCSSGIAAFVTWLSS